MEDNEPPNFPDDLYIFRWTYYNDGTSDPPPLPKPEPSQEPRELVDIDKLIAESDGIYQLWWMKWKQWHPELCLIREEVKEPVVKTLPKPKPIVKQLTCKRCSYTWTPRSKEPPVQCPKCHSPYWNRERMKK
jgi:hypothetical protein